MGKNPYLYSIYADEKSVSSSLCLTYIQDAIHLSISSLNFDLLEPSNFDIFQIYPYFLQMVLVLR